MTLKATSSMRTSQSVNVTRLANGLRIASDHLPHVDTVAVGVWVAIGARHEPASLNGIAHFLEHMAFKGTERRSAQAIAQEIETVGGQLNAYTAREQTAYYARILAEDTPLALDMLADILQHSTFVDEELERERAVILQELGQAEDTPDDIIYDFLQKTAYPDQGLGRPILGDSTTVRAISRESLFSYMRERYTPERLLIVAAGDVDHQVLVEEVTRLFSDFPESPAVPVAPAQYTGGEYREQKDLEQVHLAMAFPGVSYQDPDYYAASVLSTLFGGGMSSRLFQEVRERRGLAYSIYSYSANYQDSGLFGLYAGTGEKEVTELIPVLCEEMQKLVNTLTEDEIDRARAQLLAGYRMSRESTFNRCEQLAQALLAHDRPVLPAEYAECITAVSKSQLQSLAARILQAPLSLAAIGPVGHLEAYPLMRERLARLAS